MSAEIVVEVAAAGLAMWAAWLTIPRPPDLDWERLFKVALATVIRGDVEAAGADVDEWLANTDKNSTLDEPSIASQNKD